ncbi:MAG TPA: hypothetical protein VKZ49_12665 [Polyangiaceae bacterium]|nr:hypothetical protein [Polyangiaceae bacterium]
MHRGARARQLMTAVALGATFAFAPVATGCRTTTEDVERWANTAQGPRKLVAVLTHDKYPLELRVEAAMTLVRMKPRGGRRVGIENLTSALEELPPAERAKVVEKMVPRLVEAIRQPPPKAQASGQPEQPDPSFPFKDAAYALLTHDDGTLVQSQENRATLRAALTDWAMADFADRMDESSQMYGMDQVLRVLGSEGVARLPEQIEPNAKKIDRMADLIAELGSDDAKQRAGQRLVAVARQVDSEQWMKQKAPAVEAANKASKLNPSKKQFEVQLQQYQEEELLRVFSSMKRLGGKDIVDYLIGFAQNTANTPKRRAAALAALEGNLDKSNPQHAQAMLALAANNDTPDLVRDVALRRVGEMPRHLVIEKLYELFQNDRWQVRRVAAELALRMSDTAHVDEFMNQLRKAEGMAITEPLRYGAIIGEMKGPQKPKQVLSKYLAKSAPVQARLSALGYYYEHGTKNEISEVDALSTDKTKVPECKRDAKDCEWTCTVSSGKEQQDKEIKTVGDFVKYCVEPAMEKRVQKPAPQGAR